MNRLQKFCSILAQRFAGVGFTRADDTIRAIGRQNGTITASCPARSPDPALSKSVCFLVAKRCLVGGNPAIQRETRVIEMNSQRASAHLWLAKVKSRVVRAQPYRLEAKVRTDIGATSPALAIQMTTTEKQEKTRMTTGGTMTASHFADNRPRHQMQSTHCQR